MEPVYNRLTAHFLTTTWMNSDSETTTCAGGYPGNPIFDDTQDYWSQDYSIANYGYAGVQVPKTGTTIKVINTNA